MSRDCYTYRIAIESRKRVLVQVEDPDEKRVGEGRGNFDYDYAMGRAVADLKAGSSRSNPHLQKDGNPT